MGATSPIQMTETDRLTTPALDQDERSLTALDDRIQRCQTQTAGTELDLSNLQLLELPLEVVMLFPSLRRLNLRKNHIDALPSDFAKLFLHLVTLNLAENAISHLPELFGGLRYLQKLSVANNRLTSLPPSFSRLHALEDVDLSGNDLQQLDEELGNQLIKLKTLNLANNPRLQEIPLSFGQNLSMLRVVDLRGNDELVLVPDKLRRLHERNVILHSRAKRRELIARALRVRSAVNQTILNAAIVNPTASTKSPATNFS